jgi:alpha-N-arabinofuranosidase
MDGFESEQLAPEWQFLRCPAEPVHSLLERPSWLRLRGQKEAPGSRKTIAWVGRPILHEHWTVRCRLDFSPTSPDARAGLCLVQNDDYHLRLEVGSDFEVRMVLREKAQDRVVGRCTVAEAPRLLEISCAGHTYQGRFSADGRTWTEVATGVDGRSLTTEVAGGFVGCLVGPYAVATTTDFDWIDLRGYDE